MFQNKSALDVDLNKIISCAFGTCENAATWQGVNPHGSRMFTVCADHRRCFFETFEVQGFWCVGEGCHHGVTEMTWREL